MAIPIQDGGLIASRLQALLKIQGRLRPELEEFVIPTIQVADLAAGGAPPITRHAVARCFQAAVPAERFVARLDVPPSVLVEVRRFICNPTTGGNLLDIRFGSTFSAPGNFGISQFYDTRISNTDPATVLAFGTQVAAISNPSWRAQIEAGGQLIYEPPRGSWLVGGNLSAFGFLEFAWNALNEAMDSFVVEWDEYQIF